MIILGIPHTPLHAPGVCFVIQNPGQMQAAQFFKPAAQSERLEQICRLLFPSGDLIMVKFALKYPFKNQI